MVPYVNIYVHLRQYVAKLFLDWKTFHNKL
jgi:hypothetical protein